MNGDVQELLREGLDRLTADTRVPAGMLARARTRVRRRKIALRAALACGTAVATVAAVIAVAGPGAQPGTSSVVNARTTAFVIKRVENALAAETLVYRAQSTASDGTTSIAWAYGPRNRYEEFYPATDYRDRVVHGKRLWDFPPGLRGQPYLAQGTALVGGKLADAYVTYFDHRYSLAPLGHYHLKPCSVTARLAAGGPAVTVPDWPAFIKAMLSCQAAIVTGQARIGGVETTVISGSADVALPQGYARTIKEARVRARWRMYVDSATYLPVRVDGSTRAYGGPGGPTISTSVTNVQWLPPTAANTAQALVTIPSGFQLWTGPFYNQ
jgi:hypothetical protein